MTWQLVVGVAHLFLWPIYLGQILSVVNLNLARRLGLQETEDTTDAQYRRDTAYTARWDILSMWVLPLGGTLMVLDHALWPQAAAVGGALYLDTGARQFLKLKGLRSEGVRVGTDQNVRLALFVYSAFFVLGLVGIGSGLLGLGDP